MIRLALALLILLAPPLAAQHAAGIDYAKLREETAQRLSEYIRICSRITSSVSALCTGSRRQSASTRIMSSTFFSATNFDSNCLASRLSSPARSSRTFPTVRSP